MSLTLILILILFSEQIYQKNRIGVVERYIAYIVFF